MKLLDIVLAKNMQDGFNMLCHKLNSLKQDTKSDKCLLYI
jgi:hypothetical protein